MGEPFNENDAKYRWCGGIHIKTACYIIEGLTVLWALCHLFYSGFAKSVMIFCALEVIALICLSFGLYKNKRKLMWPYMFMQSASVKFIIVRLVLYFFHIDHSSSMDKDMRIAYYLKVTFVCIFYICSCAFAFYSLYIAKRCHGYLHDLEDSTKQNNKIEMA